MSQSPMSGSWRIAARETLTTLRNSPLRTLLSTFGVLVGIGALAAILSLGSGLEAVLADEEARSQDPYLIRVAPEVIEITDGVMVPPIRIMRPVTAHLDSVGMVVEGAAVALRVHSMERIEIKGADAPLPSEVRLVSAAYFEVEPVPLLAGRLVPHGAIVNEALVASLGLMPDEILGRTVLRGDASYPIVGVVANSRPRAPSRLILPLDDARSTDAGDSPATILVRIADSTQRRAAVLALRRWVDESFWPGAAEVSAAGQSYQRSIGQIRVVKFVVGAIAGIAVLAGAIGIMNIMLASVLERTREIGIRMACGARRRDIRRQFLLESVVVSLTGAAVGIVLGFGLASLIFVVLRRTIDEAPPVHASLPPLALFAVLVIAVFVGALAGWYPAGRAARLAPAEAIRVE